MSISGTNFRAADPGLATVWPGVSADMERVADTLGVTISPRTRPRHSWFAGPEEVVNLEVGGATLVDRRDWRRLVYFAQDVNPEARFRVERKGSAMIVERVK